MMVEERSPYVDNIGQLDNDLNKLAAKLEKISVSSTGLSEEEVKELTSKIETFNETLSQGFWEDKRLSPEKNSSAH